MGNVKCVGNLLIELVDELFDEILFGAGSKFLRLAVRLHRLLGLVPIGLGGGVGGRCSLEEEEEEAEGGTTTRRVYLKTA